jgi:hypothetical protein
VYFLDENTYKTFGVGDETVGDLHKLMQEKMEKGDDEARKYGIVEKKPDGGTPSLFSSFASWLIPHPERFPDITEKISNILSVWDKEKKKGKGDSDFQFWWKERPFENRVSPPA